MPSIRRARAAAKRTRVGDACAKPTLKEMCKTDPYEQAMSSGSSWGDLEEPTVFGASPSLEELEARKEKDMLVQEDSIWNQSWSDRLGTYYADAYDLRDMTEDAYEACMTWLYEKGWMILQEDRDGVKAYPDNLPPRVWIAPPSRFEQLGESNHVHHEVEKKEGKGKSKGKCPVPRFCRDQACADAGCRYVHGDTMPRLNEPCNFGAACGANDPAKRALCIRMHPGETWTVDLVVHRPVATTVTC